MNSVSAQLVALAPLVQALDDRRYDWLITGTTGDVVAISMTGSDRQIVNVTGRFDGWCPDNHGDQHLFPDMSLAGAVSWLLDCEATS